MPENNNGNPRELRERAGCPACIAGRYHEPEEVAAHHPMSGHGFTKETGWSHELLKAEAETK